MITKKYGKNKSVEIDRKKVNFGTELAWDRMLECTYCRAWGTCFLRKLIAFIFFRMCSHNELVVVVSSAEKLSGRKKGEVHLGGAHAEVS